MCFINFWNTSNKYDKLKMDAIKFDLANLAPKMSKRFDKAEKLKIEGTNLGPQILIMDYATGKSTEKLINNLIEDNKDE